MNGILISDKPRGLTSHDVVDFTRKRFGLRKVGHAGTLDPMATGVLVLLIGSFTKEAARFTCDDKEYHGSMVLGVTTDTRDAWGKILDSRPDIDIRKDSIESAFKVFTGYIDQVPPMYSAVKFKGKKLYELARKGIKVEVKPRRLFIERLDITKVNLPQVEFRVTCSKGTYIRQLVADIGSHLGCGAHLSQLRRTRSGRFTVDQAISIEVLKVMSNKELEGKIIKDI